MSKQVGVWLIGARGGVATTCLVGWELLKRGLTEPWGLVSASKPFADVPLVDWNSIAVGGHEIRSGSLADSAEKLVRESRAFAPQALQECQPALAQVDQVIRPGLLRGTGPAIERLAESQCYRTFATPRQAIHELQADWREFVDREQVERLVVVNVASTEPRSSGSWSTSSWRELRDQLDDPNLELPASSLYALAAIEAGHAYINFTPSIGSNLNALRELANERGVCHAGRDGKTGETWMKSVLAPAFAARNLEVMSWVGHNIFGNMDGRILDDPQNKASKITSKDELLGQILGYTPQTHISIEYIRSLGDWKTAWDHIHFRGFMGTPMILQFTWQGCDSILAAPLVWDLVRFTDLAMRRGERGELGVLSPFFKSPQGATTAEFAEQMRQMLIWARGD